MLSETHRFKIASVKNKVDAPFSGAENGKMNAAFSVVQRRMNYTLLEVLLCNQFSW